MKAFELRTDTGKVIRWTGEDGEDAATRAADCLRVTIVAWREPRAVFVAGVDPRDIIG